MVGVAEGTDDAGLVVLRQRAPAAEPEVGLLRPMREGKPIHGEVVKLTPRAATPLLCDVEVTLPAPAAAVPAAKAHKGPARVANARYRDGWERVFASRSAPEGEPS